MIDNICLIFCILIFIIFIIWISKPKKSYTDCKYYEIKRRILKPRRGNKTNAEIKLVGDNKLESGEIFFEVPDTGIGTGAGKIKMGDGIHDYKDLPYFLE